MSLEPLRPRTFDKTSPVTAYWLPRSDGFEVVGGRRPAVVEHAVFDDDPLHPVALRVRRGHRGRMLIPIDAVEAVCPLARVLYVRRPPSVAARAGVGLVALGAGAGRVARTGGCVSAALWRAGAPRAQDGARATFGAARRRWPSVRRGAVVAGEVAFFLGLMLATVVASAVTMAGRLLRLAFRSARRHAPKIAALARTSSVSCGRGVRQLIGVAQQQRRPSRRSPAVAVDDPEADELLDSPLRAELEARGQVLQHHIRAAPIE
jgi:hypothetical protein